MTSAIKHLITHLSHVQRTNQIFSCFSMLVLAGWLSWGTNQPALAIPLFFCQSQPSSGIFMAQQGEIKVPPAVVNAVREDLSRRTNIATEQLKLKTASLQTWPNGCLGLAAPDEFCSQALVEGWRVVIFYKDQTWVYRTDSQGRTLRIEN